MGYINSVLSNPAFQVFLIAMIGYIIGRIKIKGIEVGDAGFRYQAGLTDSRPDCSEPEVLLEGSLVYMWYHRYPAYIRLPFDLMSEE